MSHPIENIMKTTMEQIKQMVDVNTIMGAPIMTDSKNMVLPVSKVSLGFLSGGGEYGNSSPVRRSGENVSAQAEEERFPFAGSAVAGMSLTPMAFLSVSEGCVKVLPAHYNCTLDRIVEMMPQAVAEAERIIKETCQNRKERGQKAKTPSVSPAPVELD